MAFVAGVAAGLTSPGSTITTGSINTSGQVGLAGVIWLNTFQTQPIATISDSVNGSSGWTAVSVSPYNFGGSTFYLYCYVNQNMSGGAAQTFTATVSGGGVDMTICVETFSGRSTSGALIDGTPQTYLDGGFVQTHPGPSYTTTTTGSDLAGCFPSQGSASETFTAGSGYTIGAQALGSGSTYITAVAMYKTNVAIGTYTMNFSTAGFDESGGIMIALKPTAVVTSSSKLLLLGIG